MMNEQERNNYNENYAFLFMEKPKRKRIKAVYRSNVKELDVKLKELEAERTETYLIVDTGEIPQTS